MAFVITSKTRSRPGWKDGKRIEVRLEMKENERRGEAGNRQRAERRVESAIRQLASDGIDLTSPPDLPEG